MIASQTTVFRCALCGARFSHAGLVCRTCPMRPACDVVQCPNCGYQFPRSSKTLDWLKRAFARARSSAP
jgi:DNA-directed RNA polymerase subunit RPC12/RpoP